MDNTLENYKEEYLKLADKIEKQINEGATLTDFHLFLLTIIHRMIHVNKGVVLLVENQCYEAAAPLLRSLLDSVLILWGYKLVDDPNKYIVGMLKGERYSKLKLHINKWDFSLTRVAKTLDESGETEGMEDSYDSLCSYVHFSGSHLLSMVDKDNRIIIEKSTIDNDPMIISNIIGSYNDFNSILLDILDSLLDPARKEQEDKPMQ